MRKLSDSPAAAECPACVRYDHFPAALFEHHKFLLRAARDKLTEKQQELQLE